MKSEVPVSGAVVEFDAHIGLGRIRLYSGVVVLFHCAEIADGTRHIEIGQAVSCVVRRKFDRDEAFAIRAV